MKSYSSEIREAALRRLLPPKSESLADVSRDMGISTQTLLNWKKKALSSSEDLSLHNADDSSQFSSEEKFDIVLATASLNEAELGEYARTNGLFVEQIRTWHLICRKANANFGAECKRFNNLLKEKDDQIKALQQDLNKKNKALAEMAAEIVLRKKCSAIWGEERVE